MLRSNDDDDDEQEGEGESDTDNQCVFDLTAPSPPQLPRQYSVDLMLETYYWKEIGMHTSRLFESGIEKRIQSFGKHTSAHYGESIGNTR